MILKLVFSIVASIILVAGYVPYFRDIFLKKTRPHAFTWLVWAITLGTATLAMFYGGGNFAVVSFAIGEVLIVAIFLLSLKFGTKNITKMDGFALLAALIAILFWWQLKNPVLSVIAVSVIDVLGYIPTLRKSFFDPWSETVSFWAVMIIVDILVILSSSEYNSLTVTYPATLAATNLLLLIECLIRRIRIKPNIINF